MGSLGIFLIFLVIIVIIVLALYVAYRLNPKLIAAGLVISTVSSIWSSISNGSKATSPSRVGGGSDIDFDRVEIIEPISSGMFGTVYKVKYEGKHYALKRQKVLDQGEPQMIKVHSMIQSLDCAPNFIKILGWRIHECDFINTPRPFLHNQMKYNTQIATHLDALYKSKHCLDVLMELGGDELQKYVDDDIAEPKPLRAKYDIMRQLLNVVRCVRRKDILLNDFHFANILTARADTSTAEDNMTIKIIDYDEVQTLADLEQSTNKGRAAHLKEMFNCNDDLFSIIVGCMRANYIFEKYLSRLKELPRPSLMVDRLRASGKWAEVKAHLNTILQHSALEVIVADDQVGRMDEIGMYIDFTWGIVDPGGYAAFWREYVPEYTQPPDFIPASDLKYILDHYWDMDQLVDHFAALAACGGRV
jgi:hypothetical protein